MGDFRLSGQKVSRLFLFFFFFPFTCFFKGLIRWLIAEEEGVFRFDAFAAVLTSWASRFKTDYTKEGRGAAAAGCSGMPKAFFTTPGALSTARDKGFKVNDIQTYSKISRKN